MEKTEVKPKLTKFERAFVEAFYLAIWIARDENNLLFLFDEEPTKFNQVWVEEIDSSLIEIDQCLFPFITWESGKAWSKAELLALEVEE